MSTYFIILICAFIPPLLLSFDKKVAFYKLWPGVFLSIIPVSVFFIIWDVYFVKLNVWSFNPEHLSGIYLMNLPLEEVLFFIIIPYACLFTYEVVLAYFSPDIFKKIEKVLTYILIILFLLIGLLSLQKIYTSTTFLLLAFFLIMLKGPFKAQFLNHAFIAYFLIAIPFFIVNGLLTGLRLNEPVVLYNNDENLGIRLLTIPVEDFFYGMLLYLLNVFLLEKFKKRHRAKPEVS